MTSLATIIGLVPTALALERGGEANQPLALAVVGGLTSSTILSLFLCPVMFLFFAKLTRRETLEEGSQAPAVADLQGAQPSATA
jgi:Cu/Ag efflux pump CusA